MNKREKIIESLGAGFRFTVLLLAIVGLVSLSYWGVMMFTDFYLKKQNIVDCLKAQDQALEFQDKFWVTKEFYAKCSKVDVIINVKDLR